MPAEYFLTCYRDAAHVTSHCSERNGYILATVSPRGITENLLLLQQ